MRESDDLLKRLLGLHPKYIDLSLDRMHRLLAALDHPERNCPPIIHIAGTNGKGSTLAFIRAMLTAAGARVHAYSSPHLVDFHERISLIGVPISEPDLARHLATCEAANAGAPITFFEITTAAAFLAFAETPADWLLLEVGLGGRLDATNVITPELSVITPISIDHQEFLGDELTAIAGEKAGIIKPGVPVIAAPQSEAVADMLDAVAAQNNTNVQLGGRDWSCSSERDGMVFQDFSGLLDLPAPRLQGPHQIINAGTALAAARQLGLSTSALQQGVTTANWPARLQRLTQGPLVEAIHQQAPLAEIWLDGGHNAAAAQSLASWLMRETARKGGKTALLCGLLNTKSADSFLDAFTDLADLQILATTIPEQENSQDGVSLASVSRHQNSLGFDTPRAAIAHIDPSTQRLVICGSLYLAGWVLRQAS